MDRLKNVPGWAGFAITLNPCNFGLGKPQTRPIFFLILWMLAPLAGLAFESTKVPDRASPLRFTFAKKDSVITMHVVSLNPYPGSRFNLWAVAVDISDVWKFGTNPNPTWAIPFKKFAAVTISGNLCESHTACACYKIFLMHNVHCAYPSPALNPFVRTYAERELENEGSIWTPVPAYLEQLLNFEFLDPTTVLPNDGRLGLHSCNVTGAQTEGRAQVLLAGKMHSFAIFFWPSGLSRLFGVPMNQLPNHAFEAASVLGGWVEGLRARLAELSTFGLRVDLVEEVLGRRAAAVRANDGMLDTADRILARKGVVSITKTASEWGLSVRQFERKFGAATGMSPKRCARIARFQSALEAKVARPDRTWLDIAHDLHFHDQMHMIHDFQSLAANSPGGALSRLADHFPPAMLTRGKVHDLDS